jgi:hypothetical protein
MYIQIIEYSHAGAVEIRIELVKIAEKRLSTSIKMEVYIHLYICAYEYIYVYMYMLK